MLNQGIQDILAASRSQGWVFEPEAKRLLGLAGLPVPRYTWVKSPEAALEAAAKIGYPVVGKVVSPQVLHKSDVGGVVPQIETESALKEVFARFSQMAGFSGMLIEERLDGMELIVGAKIDYQFGPVVLLGIGGTRAELYQDVSLRMAPLKAQDVPAMARCLKARRSLEGYRGAAPVDMAALTRLLTAFSNLVMALENEIDSIDLNPVMCAAERCVIADARIVLKT